MSEENQMESTRELFTMPTHLRVQRERRSCTTTRSSGIPGYRSITAGPMPVAPEVRAIWDAMRPSYQAVLAGTKTAEQAARDMQALALQRIAEMNE